MAGRGRIVGSNLGSISYENGDGPATAEVRHARYSCDAGHVTDVPFSAEATDLPAVWDCSTCLRPAAADGLAADLRDAAMTAAGAPRNGNGKPAGGKTPWEHVRERRSIAELEVILDERLALLRGRLRASA